MIIKSLSRKSASYDQLAQYMQRGSVEGFTIYHNLYRTPDTQKIIQTFEQMGEWLPQRKNGNMLYHEILSLKRQDGVDLALQQDALYAMVHQYLAERAPGQLAYGCLHIEPGHLHVHLMISPNRLDRPTKRIRLPKAQLWELQGKMEMFLQERWPELREPSLYSRKPAPALKKTEREAQLEQRTGKPSIKSQVKDQVEAILEQSTSQPSLQARLAAADMQLEIRGTNPVILAGGRRYRLRTLGLMPAYERLLVLDGLAQQLQAQDTAVPSASVSETLSPAAVPDRAPTMEPSSASLPTEKPPQLPERAPSAALHKELPNLPDPTPRPSEPRATELQPGAFHPLTHPVEQPAQPAILEVKPSDTPNQVAHPGTMEQAPPSREKREESPPSVTDVGRKQADPPDTSQRSWWQHIQATAGKVAETAREFRDDFHQALEDYVHVRDAHLEQEETAMPSAANPSEPGHEPDRQAQERLDRLKRARQHEQPSPERRRTHQQEPQPQAKREARFSPEQTLDRQAQERLNRLRRARDQQPRHRSRDLERD